MLSAFKKADKEVNS